MCDPRDLGTTIGDAGGDASRPARKAGGHLHGAFDPTLFVYEHVPGGTGLAERIWEQATALLARALTMIEGCPCATGCPACVGVGESWRKATALELLGIASR
jgi:DEAD/DEAH box helicase domain-containing protein